MTNGGVRLRSMIAVALLATGVFLAAGRILAQREPEANTPEEESLRAFLHNYLKDPRVDETKVMYSSSFVDLKDDGTQEAIVYIRGEHLCGSGGCITLVLAPQGPTYKLISKTTIGWPPIYVLATKSHGWHDLAIRVEGGGIRPGYEAKLSYNGNSYPSNPSVPPAKRLVGKIEGTVVIPANAKGKPLY